MKVGYARISTQDQNFDLQIDALEKEGCQKVIKDTMSGAKEDRDGLNEVLNIIRKGDTLVVWRLDRLGRSLQHPIQVIKELDDRNCFFKSIQENIDTTSSGGKLIFHIFGALAEFERSIISERTLAGLESARARGRVGGRPKKMDEKKIALARRLHSDTSNSIAEICDALDISKTSLYRYLREGADISTQQVV